MTNEDLAAQTRINKKIRNKFSKLIEEAMNDFTKNVRRDTISLDEVNALTIGIHAGVKLYSSCIDIFITNIGFDKDTTLYTRNLRKQIDQGTFALTQHYAAKILEMKGKSND
jgi:hypothetical protein